MKPFWANRNSDTEKPVRNLLTKEMTIFQYTHGVTDPARISRDSYTVDQYFLDRPGNAAIQLDQNATAQQIALSAAVQKPIAVKCIQEPVPTPAWRSKPSWYLIAEEDRMINPKTQRFMAGRMGAKVRSSGVDVSPMYSAPDLVIDVILEAASVTLGDWSLPGRVATG
jgi:hypothetical protein